MDGGRKEGGVSETKTITVPVFRDPEGNPTCIANAETGEACPFFRVQKFGMHETCLFAAVETTGLQTERMQRRDNGKGFLIPLACCPLWSQTEENK